MDCEACSRGLTASQCRYCKRYVCPKHAAPSDHGGVTWEALNPGVDFNRLAKIDSHRKAVKIAAASLAFMIAGLFFFNPPIIANSLPTSAFSEALNSIITPVVRLLGNVTGPLYSYVAPVSIDSGWTTNFVSILNHHRTTPLLYCPQLDDFAKQRFSESVAGTNWQISSFGLGKTSQIYFGGYNSIREVVLHPAGYKPIPYYDTYVNSLSSSSALDPRYTAYSYHIGTASGVVPSSLCLAPLPPEGVNMTQYYPHNGCSTTIENTTWLVFELASTCTTQA